MQPGPSPKTQVCRAPHSPPHSVRWWPFFLREGGRTAGGGGLSPSRRAPLTHAPTPRRPLRLLAIFLAPSEVGQPAAATSRVDLFSSGARRSFFIGVRRRRRLLHRGHRADRSVGSRPRAASRDAPEDLLLALQLAGDLGRDEGVEAGIGDLLVVEATRVPAARGHPLGLREVDAQDIQVEVTTYYCIYNGMVLHTVWIFLLNYLC